MALGIKPLRPGRPRQGRPASRPRWSSLAPGSPPPLSPGPPSSSRRAKLRRRFAWHVLPGSSLGRSLCRVRSSRPVSLLPSQPCTLPAFLFMSLPPTACDCGKRRAVCTLSPAGNPAPIRPKCGWQGEAGSYFLPFPPPGNLQ